MILIEWFNDLNWMILFNLMILIEIEWCHGSTGSVANWYWELWWSVQDTTGDQIFTGYD